MAHQSLSASSIACAMLKHSIDSGLGHLCSPDWRSTVFLVAAAHLAAQTSAVKGLRHSGALQYAGRQLQCAVVSQ